MSETREYAIIRHLEDYNITLPELLPIDSVLRSTILLQLVHKIDKILLILPISKIVHGCLIASNIIIHNTLTDAINVHYSYVNSVCIESDTFTTIVTIHINLFNILGINLPDFKDNISNTDDTNVKEELLLDALILYRNEALDRIKYLTENVNDSKA